MYGGFRIHPAPLPPNGNVARKKQPPSICSFPAVARNHTAKPAPTDPTARVCLVWGWATRGPASVQGSPLRVRAIPNYASLPPVLGFSGPSSGLSRTLGFISQTAGFV